MIMYKRPILYDTVDTVIDQTPNRQHVLPKRQKEEEISGSSQSKRLCRSAEAQEVTIGIIGTKIAKLARGS